MSQDFELKFDEYKDNDPTNNDEGGNDHPYHYSSTGNNRNLVFVLSDGKMQFFNYSYLITASYNPDNCSILMEFTTHHVVLKGERLEVLFNEIMMQKNRAIHCTEERYQALTENAKAIVNHIIIQSKEHEA